MASARKIASVCLFPLTVWYAVGVALRNMLFAMGVKKEQAPHVTTIGVGNLATGGTGKTPHTEYLLRLLADDYRTAFLSRGYRRKSKGFLLCEGTPDAEALGDEPAMVARKFPNVTTAVCEKRLVGIQRLLQSPNPPQLIVMDDVYQHRYVKPSVNILLTEYRHPYCNDHILPFGDLREFRSAHRRANIIVVTKCPAKLNPIEKNNILLGLKPLNCQRVFFSYLDYGKPVPLFGSAPIEEKPANVLLLTGIAHPDPLVDHVARQSRVTLCRYPDHHDFSADDIKEVLHKFDEIPGTSKVILTTEKDAERLRQPQLQELLHHLPVGCIPVEVRFHTSRDYDFDTIIRASVKENTTFLHRLQTSALTQGLK